MRGHSQKYLTPNTSPCSIFGRKCIEDGNSFLVLRTENRFNVIINPKLSNPIFYHVQNVLFYSLQYRKRQPLPWLVLMDLVIKVIDFFDRLMFWLVYTSTHQTPSLLILVGRRIMTCIISNPLCCLWHAALLWFCYKMVKNSSVKVF